MSKLCKDCEYFKISYEPQRIGRQLVDFGQARCDKYNLVTDFVTHKKFEKLTCQYDDLKEHTRGKEDGKEESKG